MMRYNHAGLHYQKPAVMTDLLKKAFSAASSLPDDEQDALATWLLAELASERKWNELLSSSQEALDRFAGEAVDEHAKGDTEALDHRAL
jgi:hypothetical protein